ncbi:MAG: prolyl oligopeptidase family serine peptidase [Candidatus Poribacteria bacterium]|nr:prolyl oligopeptidase family serine peptidase [Candidatus Poribacteria bacterium]
MRVPHLMILTAITCSSPSTFSVATPHKDPYIWLEGVEDEKALAWVRSRNDVTEQALKAYPAFQEIYDGSLEILNAKERIAYPSFRDAWLYNFWQDEKNERGIWRRTTLEEYRKDDPQWEILLDIDALSVEEGKKWVFKGSTALYPNYDLCMVSLSRGGGDAVEQREFDVEKKTFVKDGFFVPEAKCSVQWKNQDTLYITTNFGEGTTTDSGYPRIVKEWERGTPLSEARTIFVAEPADVAVWPGVINTPERQYDIVYHSITFYKSHVYVIEDGELFKLDYPEDADFRGFFKNQLLVHLKTDWTVDGTTYKQGSLIGIDYDLFRDGNRDFVVIVEPDERSSIVSVSTTKNLLLVNMLNDVRSELYAFHFRDGQWQKQRVDTPDYGTISVGSTDENSDRYFFTYTDFLTPSSLYLVSDENQVGQLKSLPAFFDAAKFEVKQFEATSKDGTPIPYFVVHAKDTQFGGNNPTLLYGYGGFEIPMQPEYSAITGQAWLERGGVYVLANIRGGGEFGPKWHHAALKENRQRAYDDFIAVAEDLIVQKTTSPQHLGIMGGSNGGLLVGVAFTQRPDLFNAVVCSVPLLDMKRFNKLFAGASWMAEYGNPDKPDEWAYIKKYSPYHNVVAGKKYPKVFFNTSTRDDRVHPGHARKMVAKMLEMGHDVYYYENIEGGHAAATTNAQRAFRNALVYAYLHQQLQ